MTQPGELARRRRIERHCSAALRAVSAAPGAELRNAELYLGGQPAGLRVPHLLVDARTDHYRRCRGAADATALRLRFSDPELHRERTPESPLAVVIFDILEQLRVEALAASFPPGLAANVDGLFHHWRRDAHGEGMVESELGLLLFGITEIVRARLGRPIDDEQTEGVIESIRFRIAPLIGHDLARLKPLIADQAAYAEPALNIARTLDELAPEGGLELPGGRFAALWNRPPAPPDSEVDERYVEPGGGDAVRLDADPAGFAYRVFTRAFDRTLGGAELYREAQRRRLRARLDRMVAQQAVSVPGLAMRLRNLFAVHGRPGWRDGEEEGRIDGRCLGQVVCRPGYTRVFRREKPLPYCDVALTFLVDNSGSMKRQYFETVAILIDLYCRALDLAGVTTEVLGFTTGGWAGGEAARRWRQAGRPQHPGRLNERLHVVYKDADTGWKRARHSICSLLNPAHFREGLDGEALEWAAGRLMRRAEARKCLVMISDGAPMDTATSNCNGGDFLERHLRRTARKIERDGVIELKAIGVGLEMHEFFSHSLNLDLSGTLGRREVSSLETLFSGRRRQAR